MAVRSYTCRDCGKAGTQYGGGRLRERCDGCRTRADAQRMRRVRSGLTVAPEPPVSPPETPATPAQPPSEPSQPVLPGRVAVGVAEVLAVLDVGKPAGPALRALAEALARDVDAARDPKDRVAASRELRATLADLVEPVKEAGGDPFGLEGMRATAVGS